jgi:hypothetical protein
VVKWQNVKLPKWQVDKMASRQSGNVAKLQNGKLPKWQVDKIAKWQNGKAANWPFDTNW